jgi:hypothetical protein
MNTWTWDAKRPRHVPGASVAGGGMQTRHLPKPTDHVGAGDITAAKIAARLVGGRVTGAGAEDATIVAIEPGVGAAERAEQNTKRFHKILQ